MRNTVADHKVSLIDSDRAIRHAGYWVVILLLGFGGLWSGCAPIESAALAPGIVQVEGKRKAVQHLEGGIVSEILVASGDWVERDQPLLILDTARHAAERDILKGRLFNERATVDRLTAERDDDMTLKFSPALIDAAVTDERAANAILNEQALFLARQADRRGEEDVIQSQRRGLEAVLDSKLAVERSLQQEVADLNALLDEGYVDKQRLRELERSRTQLLGEIADIRVSIEEADLTIIQLSKRFKTQVVDELAEAVEALYDAEQQYAAADDRVQRATIRAPVSGTVLNLLPNTIGAVIGSGETLLEIVPRIADLVIDARVSPLDIDRVTLGQPAEVRFSVFKDAYMVSGTLVKLSADRLIDSESDFPYYSAEIQLKEDDLYLLEGMTLVPGMPAEVLIKTGERTLLGYVTSPMRRLFSRSLIED